MTQAPIDAALITWLDEHAGTRSIEAPLRFEAPDAGKATVSHGATSHLLTMDSTALSMTLRMHLERHCDSFPCTVWVRGTWGPLVPTPMRDSAVFTVREVLGPVDGTPATIRIGD